MIIIIAKEEKRNLKKELGLLAKIRDALKEDPIAIQICEEFDFTPEIIDGVPIDFDDELEASAKTVESRIYLNSNLMNEDFEIIMRYAIHELVHVFQHMRSGEPGQINFDKSETSKDYLDQTAEMNAFQKQVVYQDSTTDNKDVASYIKNLLDFHDIPMAERPAYAKKILSEVEDPDILKLILKSLRDKPKSGKKNK
jgi:hypothetical protein